MNRAWPSVLAVALVIGAAPNEAAAFCQATTVNEGQAMCGQVGEPLWWPTPCLSYAVDTDGSQWLDASQTRAAVDTGFRAWSSVTCSTGPTDIQFRRLADSTCLTPEYNDRGGNVNTVAFLDPWIDPRDGSVLNPESLAFTVVWSDTGTGEILDADMLINDTRRWARCPTDGSCTEFDLDSVVTHEAGHFIGIGHSLVRDATMFNEASPAGDIEMRSLEQDDIDATCTIYPPGSLRSVCGESDFTPRGGLDLNCEDNMTNGSGGGCSTAIGDGAQDAWASALLCLALFIWPRRRTGVPRDEHVG
ncbi:MAG: M10 family metallopeptidase domain-containing protein [Myxococcales bacterium]|nr:M10 family metallopeptidase domain-containing protein [Myxococcales bacterium]